MESAQIFENKCLDLDPLSIANALATALCPVCGDGVLGAVPVAPQPMSMGGSDHIVEARISGGGSRGVLEMNIDGGGWGAVCDDWFGDTEATAFCGSMGFLGRGTTYDTTHGDDEFAADDIQCDVGSKGIATCKTHRAPYTDNCGDSETVGIHCYGAVTEECDDGASEITKTPFKLCTVLLDLSASEQCL
eukprot:SAG22_NODE_1277_length_4907_cov_2.638311_2_plen_190_part_00